MQANPADKMVVVVVVDMQDGMWQAVNDDDDPEKEPDPFITKLRAGLERRRQSGMDALAEDLQPFVDTMRSNGAHIVWAMMESDDVVEYGDLYKMQPHDQDDMIWKNTQSAYESNVEFFEAMRDEAEAQGKELEIKVCGLWALECVINTDVSLHKAGYNSRMVGDMILDSAKPSQDDDRPNRNESHAIWHATQATDRENACQWADDLVRQQREIFAAQQARRDSTPGNYDM